ncbi:MAG: ATP-binding cassette domain-containing protein [Propionibacteriaceae bacterium]|jgi:ABC-2 type transport system ATP-binding protein|nr:ATP-binding cassette domain-containing protein [Propionibacteriaceae bacterium]
MDFGQTTVIRELSFDVGRGETFGFLGSNGSGKTTTLRALLGIYEPTAGVLEIDGRRFDPADAGSLGYLPEERGLYKKEPVLDVMVYFGQLKGMTAAAAKKWSLDYLERVDMGPQAKLRVDKCSGGQQQKVQLGVTIMNRPDLLILDEPTKGFDPVNRQLLMDIIFEQKTAGSTIVMVTHEMEQVERLCDRIVLLKDGTARAYGSVTEVQEQFGGTTVQVTSAAPLPASDEYRVLSDDGADHVELALAPGTDTAALLADWVRQGIAVSSFTPGRRSLNSIFVEVYGETAAGEA